MKKMFFVGALALAGAMNAQEIKPTTGDISTEFGLTGGILNTEVKLANSDLFFKGRYFKSDKLAYRASFTLNTSSDRTNKEGTNFTGKDVESSTNFLLGFGLEKHFTGTDRLSPYVGGELLIGSSSQTVTNETNFKNGDFTKTTVKGPNTFGFGVRGVFGADYYFAKKVFLGVEAGLQMMYASTGKTVTTNESKLGSNSTTVTTEVPGGSNFNISSTVITGVRLGFVF